MGTDGLIKYLPGAEVCCQGGCQCLHLSMLDVPRLAVEFCFSLLVSDGRLQALGYNAAVDEASLACAMVRPLQASSSVRLRTVL